MAEINWANRKFDAKYLRSLLYYGASTGYWFWLVDRGINAKAGSRAGCYSDRYWVICINGIAYSSSVLAWLYVTGEWPPDEVDHKNRNSLDDRWENLRLATRSQQNINQGLRSDNTSGVKGVCVDKTNPTRPWHSQINIDGKHINLGSYKTFDQAVAARRAAELKYFGEFAPQYAAE